jgi:peptide chain release factor subunit 1
LILAGLADFKTELSESDMFDLRLKQIIVKIVDVSYGGENGFNQAIELSADALSNVKFVQEKKLITTFFEEISQDTGRYCFGVGDTLKALELGAVETLIVWENLEVTRYILKNPTTGGKFPIAKVRFFLLVHSANWIFLMILITEELIKYLRKDQETDESHFRDKKTNELLETVEAIALLEWFANNYKKFGALLEIVTNKSQEGSQFCRGFGGIGGILRYKVDFMSMDFDEESDEE